MRVCLSGDACVRAEYRGERERERKERQNCGFWCEFLVCLEVFWCKRVYERGGGFPQLGGCCSELRKASDQLSLHLWL